VFVVPIVLLWWCVSLRKRVYTCGRVGVVGRNERDARWEG
jgi:hypothetical protein